eukprot:6233538-Alexandrium_andersonii.AAC.1
MASHSFGLGLAGFDAVELVYVYGVMRCCVWRFSLLGCCAHARYRVTHLWHAWSRAWCACFSPVFPSLQHLCPVWCSPSSQWATAG